MIVTPTEQDAARQAQSLQRMNELFARQRAAFAHERNPSEAVRRDRLDRAIALLSDHRLAWCDAMAADFSCRSRELSLIVDIVGSIDAMRFAKKNLRRWMRPERRGANFPYNLLGARAELHHQPKGVVGNIVPWNFPVGAMFAPMAGALAAGNRVMIKLSELSPNTAALAERLLAEAFDPAEVCSVDGGPEVGAGFAALPFDHIIFTGSTRVGSLVMQAAAANLTPVTLELGGKSPVIVGRGADLRLAARRIVWGKLLNGGQACIAPDYAFVPAEQLDNFVNALRAEIGRQYPTLRDNPDYTSIIGEPHLRRLQACVDEARGAGVKVLEINPAQEDFAQGGQRKFVPTLLIDPGDDLRVMREEIFGPLLPIRTYADIAEAIAHVNARPHPLALYVFGEDAETQQVLSSTTSGGAAVNDTMVHVLQDQLPFGGVGASGMGAYHAEFGFRSFSHARAVFRSVRIDPLALLRPPYGVAARRLLDLMARRR
jgi:coniferyl-aldehyde dehydrogenase